MHQCSSKSLVDNFAQKIRQDLWPCGSLRFNAHERDLLTATVTLGTCIDTFCPLSYECVTPDWITPSCASPLQTHDSSLSLLSHQLHDWHCNSGLCEPVYDLQLLEAKNEPQCIEMLQSARQAIVQSLHSTTTQVASHVNPALVDLQVLDILEEACSAESQALITG